MSANSTSIEGAIRALEGVKLTRMRGRPTTKNITKTRGEIGAAFARAKTSHKAFPLGPKFGFAAAVLNAKKFIKLHNKAATNLADVEELPEDWAFEYPTRPSTYPEMGGTTGDIGRRRKEAQNQEEIAQFDRFEGYEAAFKMKVAEAYDEATLEVLHDELLEFTHVTLEEMLKHLEEQCHALTSREKATKIKEIWLPWNHADEDIESFFNKLDKLEEELMNDYKVEWPITMKMNHATNELGDSEQFTEEEFMTWEDKEEDEKTWVALVQYFTKLWTKRRRYGKSSVSRGLGYESALEMKEREEEHRGEARLNLSNNLREMALAATADKDHIQQMSTSAEEMLAIIKKQAEQIDKLVDNNAKLTDAISKRGAARSRPNKPTTTKAEEAGESTSKKKDKCGICGKHYNTKNCYELEQNKEKRPEHWKSIFDE